MPCHVMLSTHHISASRNISIMSKADFVQFVRRRRFAVLHIHHVTYCLEVRSKSAHSEDPLHKQCPQARRGDIERYVVEICWRFQVLDTVLGNIF